MSRLPVLRIHKSLISTIRYSSLSTSTIPLNWKPKICLVGSGPASLYSSQYLLKHLNNNVNIDIYEKLPVPFGLVRYGVAPDHQEVKNVINSFTENIKHENVQFFGNINIGQDLKINELLEAYDAIVLAYGSLSENYLNIPGEKEFKNIIASKDFVGWYNGLPENKNFSINLNTKNAVIIGAGNVAIDVARILLSPIDKLDKTDITNEAIQKLKEENKIEQITIVARRGFLNAAFTLKELRELTKIDSIKCSFNLNDFKFLTNLDQVIKGLDRPRKRLTEFMLKLAKDGLELKGNQTKLLKFLFLHKPIEIIGNLEDKQVKGVKLEQFEYDIETFKNLNLASEEDLNKLKLKDLNKTITLDAGLLIRSIGFKNVNIDNTEIPFDKKLNVIPNDHGKVLEKEGLYCCGWIKRGPKGVIVDTTTDAYETASKLCSDLAKQSPKNKQGSKLTLDLLKQRNVRVVDKEKWLKIENEEVRRGKLVSRPRIKIDTIDEMLKIAFS